MQAKVTNKSPKCLTLASPKYSYDSLLICIKENFGEREMDDFVFAFRNDLPKTILEIRKPLVWFRELECRCLLNADDLSRVANFLTMISQMSLLKDVRCYQAKRGIVGFFQRKLEERIPGLCLDEPFKQSWTSNEVLPQNFLKKCQGLFRGIDDTSFTVRDLHVLLSRGVEFLVNSCRPYIHDVDFVARKILHFSNMVFQRFEQMIVEQIDELKDLLSGSPRSSSSNHRREIPQEPAPVVQPLEANRPLLFKQLLVHMFLLIFGILFAVC